MSIGYLLDDRVVEEDWRVRGELHVALNEGLRTERGVCSDDDILLFGQGKKILLDKVWVVLDLEHSRLDRGISEQIEQERAVVVGHTNTLG